MLDSKININGKLYNFRIEYPSTDENYPYTVIVGNPDSNIEIYCYGKSVDQALSLLIKRHYKDLLNKNFFIPKESKKPKKKTQVPYLRLVKKE